MNRLSFDKIFHHHEHLNRVLSEGDAYPLHLELGLNNFCNHDCEFCAAAQSKFEVGGDRVEIDKNRFLEIVGEMQSLGLKSTNIVGSGEPTLHRHFPEIVSGIKERGVEIGLFTNGSNARGRVAQAIIDNLTFVRFSVTGASNRVHEMAHGTRDFYRIIDNLSSLVSMRGDSVFPTIGLQFILIHYSAPDLPRIVDIARDVGVDYLAIKPVIGVEGTRSSKSELTIDETLKLLKEVKRMEGDGLEIHVKPEQTKIVYENDPGDRGYSRCLGCLTTTTLEANFNLYICDNRKKDQFLLGNLRDKGFREVWDSDRRKKVMADVDVGTCPVACRMDPLNRLYQKILDGEVEIPYSLPDPRPEDHINFL